MKKILTYFTLPLVLLFSDSSGPALAAEKNQEAQSGTLEKMTVGNGSVAMELDLGWLNGAASAATDSQLETLNFQIGPNSFFNVLVFNHALRGPDSGSIGLIARNT